MRNHRLLQILVAGTALFCTVLKSEEPVSHSEPQQPELTWCLDHFSGFHHYEDVAEPYGPSVDLMRELARRSGFTLRFTPRTTINRCFRLMEEGQVDLMSNLKFSEDRAKIMVLLPYENTIAESVFLLRSDKRPLTQFSQLKNLTIASIRGYLYSENTMQFIRQNRSHVAEVESIESGLELLYRGRVDALISPTVSTSDAIFSTSSYQDRFRIAALNISAGNNAHINIGVSRQSQYIKLLPTIERHIKAMQADGTVKRLYTDMVLSPRIKQLKAKPE